MRLSTEGNGAMKVQLETNENTMGVKDTGKNSNTQKHKIYIIQSYDLNYHITGPHSDQC